MMRPFRSDVGVRRAAPAMQPGCKAFRTAWLSGDREADEARLGDALKDKDAACFVAESRKNGLVGWIHVSTTPLLEVERRAEVNGLVGLMRGAEQRRRGECCWRPRRSGREGSGAGACRCGRNVLPRAGAKWVLFAEWV